MRPRGTPPAAIAAARRWVLRPVAPDSWDGLLWTSGAVALTGILLTSLVPPATDLAVFFSLTLLVNGPYSPLLPAAHEPVLMVFGRLYPPGLIAAVGTVGVLMVEYVNYRLYGAAVQAELFRRTRESRLVHTILAWFGRQPFLTVVVCAFTPVPFWVARIAASLSGYRAARFLVATAMGRFPRLLLYAAAGAALPVPTEVILGVGGAAAVLLSGVVILRSRRPVRARAG